MNAPKVRKRKAETKRRRVLMWIACGFAVLAVAGLLLVQKWKAGSERAQCILNIRSMQTAMRSYACVNEISKGSKIDLDKLIGPDNFMQSMPVCPAGGTYTLLDVYDYQIGTVFLTCSLGHSHKHKPQSTSSW